MKMKQNKGNVWICTGLLLIAAALLLFCNNKIEDLHAQKSVRKVMEEISAKAPKAESKEVPVYPIDEEQEMPVETIDGKEYIGVLSIPSLGLELPVLAQWNYPDLKTAPCRYAGSLYQDNLIICAHNYDAHFGRLKTLQTGDEVTFVDMDENVVGYKVVEMEILKPTNIEEMEGGDWDLTLFTCTKGGRTRVTVRCVRE